MAEFKSMVMFTMSIVEIGVMLNSEFKPVMKLFYYSKLDKKGVEV